MRQFSCRRCPLYCCGIVHEKAYARDCPVQGFKESRLACSQLPTAATTNSLSIFCHSFLSLIICLYSRYPFFSISWQCSLSDLHYLFTVLAQHTVLSLAEMSFPGMSFTEPPLDQEDFYRTYYLGQTVNIAWNESSGFWPTVNLRIGPAFEWSTIYAVLLSTHRL